MSKHPKDRAERLEVKKKKDKKKAIHIKSFQELVEHINREEVLASDKGIINEDADD